MKTLLAVLVAVAILVGSVAGSYGLTIWRTDRNNSYFCQYLSSVVPHVAKPLDPEANPSRLADYIFTVKTERFERKIGCP